MGVPPIAVTSERALAAAMRPQSDGSSTTGVKKSTVCTSAVPPGETKTAASSLVSKSDQEIGVAGDR